MSLTKDNTYINCENRIFYLSDYVDNSSIGQLCWSLIFQLQEDDKKEAKEKDFQREPIKLYINSYGGSVYDMWALIDIIINSKTPIHTYCTGYAMSAAFKIFLAGHKRFCTKHATFMYHQMSYGKEGKYQDLVEDRVQTDYLQKIIEEYEAYEQLLNNVDGVVLGTSLLFNKNNNYVKCINNLKEKENV